MSKGVAAAVARSTTSTYLPAGAYLLIKGSGKHQVQAALTGVGPVLHFVIR